MYIGQRCLDPKRCVTILLKKKYIICMLPISPGSRLIHTKTLQYFFPTLQTPTLAGSLCLRHTSSFITIIPCKFSSSFYMSEKQICHTIRIIAIIHEDLCLLLLLWVHKYGTGLKTPNKAAIMSVLHITYSYLGDKNCT